LIYTTVKKRVEMLEEGDDKRDKNRGTSEEVEEVVEEVSKEKQEKQDGGEEIEVNEEEVCLFSSLFC